MMTFRATSAGFRFQTTNSSVPFRFRRVPYCRTPAPFVKNLALEIGKTREAGSRAGDDPRLPVRTALGAEPLFRPATAG
jgi:hypothetical protein